MSVTILAYHLTILSDTHITLVNNELARVFESFQAQSLSRTMALFTNVHFPISGFHVCSNVALPNTLNSKERRLLFQNNQIFIYYINPSTIPYQMSVFPHPSSYLPSLVTTNITLRQTQDLCRIHNKKKTKRENPHNTQTGKTAKPILTSCKGTTVYSANAAPGQEMPRGYTTSPPHAEYVTSADGSRERRGRRKSNTPWHRRGIHIPKCLGW